MLEKVRVEAIVAFSRVAQCPELAARDGFGQGEVVTA